ncbi:SGNH/GDSL hydrolase family protein [Rubritepida flocculans]|uniref:SGNH/GDSL hydrolase family protein n=1 Tax=Rubritepida flocculans TaxID=182403 RepID=UPI000421341C|nr:GDSL-type esterase/lipase family protein [Rubritepida flocculans]
MRALWTLLFCLAAPLAWAGECPRAQEALPPLPGVQAELEAGEPLTIVALGSSSTEGAGASSADSAYPSRLERLLRAALPGVELRVVNAGKSGETSAEMLARLEGEVLALRPDLVIWQASGNEVLRGVEPERFLAQMREGLRRLRAIGAEVVLMDNQRAPRLEASPLAARYDATMEALSREERVPLFSRARLMRGWFARGVAPEEVLAPDGLHHNDRGYACLAEALSEALLAAAGAGRQVAGR